MIEPKSHAWLLTVGGCPVRSHFFAVGYFGLDFPERFPEIPTMPFVKSKCTKKQK